MTILLAGESVRYQQSLRRLLLNDPLRMKALNAVRELNLNDGWIGAGFVRDAVWDHLHDYGNKMSSDVDVVWFNPSRCDADYDSYLEKRLARGVRLNWSVKNQARMHSRNGDAPYLCTEDALQYWPETATAVAVRVGDDNVIEIIAPYGLSDLFELRLRPTSAFAREKQPVFSTRVAEKRWLTRYPRLQLITPL